jgi:hypothetical protein
LAIYVSAARQFLTWVRITSVICKLAPTYAATSARTSLTVHIRKERSKLCQNVEMMLVEMLLNVQEQTFNITPQAI